MNKLVLYTVGLFLGASAIGAEVLDSPHYLATIQFAVNESDPRRVPEEQSRIRVYFIKTIEGWPQLKRQTIETRTVGNEVVFYLTSDSDIHVPMQEALNVFVRDMNGKLRLRGRAEVSALSEPMAGYQVEVDASRKRLEGATARSAPLLHLLKDVKRKLISFSYAIPGRCANTPVNWNFVPSPDPKIDSVREAMSEIGSITGLKLNDHNGTYYEFTGHCSGEATAQPTALPTQSIVTMPAPNLLFEQTGAGERPYVYVPLRMLNE